MPPPVEVGNCPFIYNISLPSILNVYLQPPEVLAGRKEVFEFWGDAGGHEHGHDDKKLDDELVATMLRGIHLMMYGDTTESLPTAVLAHTLSIAKKVWTGSTEATASPNVVLIDWFAQQCRVFDVATLSKIKCPVSVIHCEEDITYALHESEEFAAKLRDGNVDSDFYRVAAPHFGHITSPELINPILCARVQSVVAPQAPVPTSGTNETKPRLLDTPFTETLMQFGYRSDDSDQDSSDPASTASGVLYM
ncbi:hypothetical protein H0H92_011324 [Tricholoma furcatifolium]|nr:hypothetical protein H0H92_011324 [Tricholoma furcatifolium]